MKPPICVICDKDFRHNIKEGGLVEFAKPERKNKPEVKKRHIPRHPDHMMWFCGEHFQEAEKLSHLEAGAAMTELRRIFS